MVKIQLIKFRTRIGETQGYFIQCKNGKFIPVMIPQGQFAEIAEKDIIEVREVEPDYNGRFL